MDRKQFLLSFLKAATVISIAPEVLMQTNAGRLQESFGNMNNAENALRYLKYLCKTSKDGLYKFLFAIPESNGNFYCFWSFMGLYKGEITTSIIDNGELLEIGLDDVIKLSPRRYVEIFTNQIMPDKGTLY